MTVIQAYRQAAAENIPEQVIADRLYEGVQEVITQGTDPANVLVILYDLYLTADADGEDIKRHAIAEVMDCLRGWTSERARLHMGS